MYDIHAIQLRYFREKELVQDNIKSVFETKYFLGNLFRKMKMNTDILDRSQCIYIIPCKCGGEIIGVTSIP